jgi:hypothetical protein
MASAGAEERPRRRWRLAGTQGMTIMAYLDHSSAFAAGAQAIEAPVDIVEPQSGFSALEWTVIALARRDRLSSLSAPGALSRALGGLFGLGRQSALADPRLEALRRMAVLAWHHSFTVPVSEVKAFLAAGFTADQYETVAASIGAARLNRKLR